MAENLTPLKKLLKAAEAYKEKRVLIGLRGAPDPDSISSALAHSFLLNHVGVDSTILHTEEISHQENRALVKLLQIDLILYNEDFNVKDYDALSLVDSQKIDIRLVDSISELPVLSVVDHHHVQTPSVNKAAFIDIRQGVGSAATIYAEYIKEVGLLTNSEEHANLATALVHGIRTDTSNLITAKEADFISMAYLSNFSDSKLLEQISRQPLSPITMEIIFKAFKNKEIADDFIISGVGIIRPEDRDALPQAADFLLRRVGVHTVIVFGIVGEYIDCSLRTKSDIIKPAAFIGEVFSDVRYGESGGKLNQGGFRIPLGVFKSMSDDPEDKELLVKLVERYIKKRFYGKLGKSETS